MATLQNVQTAMQGEQKQSSLPPEYASDTSKETPKTEQQFVIFKLKHKKRGRVYIDGINDSVLNPKTEKRERVWLINGADSIWQSELTELLKDKEYVKRNRRSLQFEDGICRISVKDDRALEFAKVINHNMGVKDRVTSGKYDFYEYDPVKESQERYNKQMKKINMVIKAKEMPVEKMRKLASFLGISFVDELGMPKGDEGIRTELMIRADNDPLNFEKYIDSAEVEVSYMVKRAIIDAKIDLTGQAGNAIWAGGKGFIAKIPAGRKPHEYLTELAMTNSDEGRVFKEQLQSIVK